MFREPSFFHILTHKDMLLHTGPITSFECPERLVSGAMEVTDIDPERYVSYVPFVEMVHQKKYIKYITDRCRNVGKKRWGCPICTFLNKKSPCEMCGNLKPENNWDYLQMVDGDTTFINQNTWKALKAAVVSVCELSTKIAKSEIQTGWALIRPPGHHATASIGQGFCLLNNVAIAAEAALAAGAKKIFIFDWDLHHGNGIQDHFYSRNDVYYCSMHGENIYPHSGHPEEIGVGKGLNYNLNIPLPKGTGDDEYMINFRDLVLPELIRYQPDMILIAAGFDGLESDPMNFLALTPVVYQKILICMKDVCAKIGLILEGGYNIGEIRKCIELCMTCLS